MKFLKTRNQRLGFVAACAWMVLAPALAGSDIQNRATQTGAEKEAMCRANSFASYDLCQRLAEAAYQQAMRDFWPLLAAYVLIPLIISGAGWYIVRWVRKGSGGSGDVGGVR